MKKLTGRVKDFRFGDHCTIVVLVFRNYHRIAVTITSINDYLISILSPYDWNFIYKNKSLNENLALLTEFYRSDIISASGKQITAKQHHTQPQEGEKG